MFWRSCAEIGDQIEERAGGLVLLTKDMVCHSIQLSAPRPIDVATAFVHADAVLREDRKILDDLLARGKVVEAVPRRSKVVPPQPPETLFAEDSPLVVTVPLRDLEDNQSLSPVELGAAAEPKGPVSGSH